MRNASGHQCKVKMRDSEKKSERKKRFWKFHVVVRFWKFHVVVVQNNGKEMYKKSGLHVKSCFFLIRPIVVFHRSPALPSPLSIT